MGLPRAAVTLAALALCACRPAVEASQNAVRDAAQATQAVTAEAAAPVVGVVQDAAAIAVEALPLVGTPVSRETVNPDALALIVSFEISSPAHYQAALQTPHCPQGNLSGPTWGIGYDGGQQSASTIRRDWGFRPDVDRLATASGVRGNAACRAWRAQNLDIRIPLEEAEQVFSKTIAPVWLSATRRAYPGIEDGSSYFEGGLVANTMNRGTSFVGSRAEEKRVVRDQCVPAGDAHCGGAQVRKSCRVWVGDPNYNGLCRRRHAEADLIEVEE